MTPLTTARATCATRLRKQAADLLAAADRIEAGEEDDSWGVKHQLRKQEAEDGAG